MNEIEKGTTAYFIERIAALEAQVQTLRELIDRHLKADAKMEGPVYYIQNCQGFGKAYTALAATEEK